MLPTDIEAYASARDYNLLARYWQIEPWGSMRDNIHAAIIAQTILQPHIKRGAKIPPLTDFLIDPQRQAKGKGMEKKQVYALFSMLANCDKPEVTSD